nr:Heat shock protein GrpE [Kibdelosporangium sp. MJ126-NF4]
MISLASLFRRTKADDETGSTTGADPAIEADSTIEVSADMIAGIDNTADQPAEQSETLGKALSERDTLVQLCLYALDRARSPGVVERLEEGLLGIGVSSIRPDGDVFDPAQHEAGGTVSTPDVTMDGVVAETEVVGFADRGRLLRAPIVTVYKVKQS